MNNSKITLYITIIASVIMVIIAFISIYISIIKPDKIRNSMAKVSFGTPDISSKYDNNISIMSDEPVITGFDFNRKSNIDYSNNSSIDYNKISDYTNSIGMHNVDDYNAALYAISDQYYQVYYDDIRVSPLLPLAMANVETPGRADNSKTWSALFPSKYVDMSLLTDFNVCYIAQFPNEYSALMHEHSTRDRGALQMSPTYGTGNAEFNDRMSGTEINLLQTCNIDPNARSWASGASNMSGDRFNIKDVLLRLCSAHTQAIHDLETNGYVPESNSELIAMLAMYHHRSGIWTKAGKKGVGKWKSGKLAEEYAVKLSSQTFLDKLISYYNSHRNKMYLTSNDIKDLLPDYTKYTSSSLEASYPVKVLYSYIVLNKLYNGV